VGLIPALTQIGVAAEVLLPPPLGDVMSARRLHARRCVGCFIGEHRLAGCREAFRRLAVPPSSSDVGYQPKDRNQHLANAKRAGYALERPSPDIESVHFNPARARAAGQQSEDHRHKKINPAQNPSRGERR
jgi:hypothetical protein